MKVIDLLNKIANDEEVPREFTYKGYLWEYDVKNKMWFYYFGESKSHRFDRLFYLNMILNDEVEIIEEPQEHKIPKKIEYHQVRRNEVEVDYIEDGIVKHFCLNKKQRYFADKINEILDYLSKEE